MPSPRTPATLRAKKRRQSAPVRPTPPPVEQDKQDRSEDRSDRLLIVGIGASAGGLEAFTQLLKHLPLDTGMGFVLVQHLDPEHESVLTQILSRATSLPVREITNNLPVQANHVYIIPRNTNLRIEQGVLKLQVRERTRTPHRPIDAFFESLAQDQRERAIGVVLSGTGSDGTLGLEAIKAAGGITLAQDDSAKQDSMPRSAVAAGCVDLVLSPVDMARELGRIAKHPYAVHGRKAGAGRGRARREDKAKGAEDGYKKIMVLLRNHCGVDFSLYKSTTIQRRITRRMVLAKEDTRGSYARFLQGNTQELDSLFSDVAHQRDEFLSQP